MKKIPPFQLEPKALNDEAKSLPGFKWADDEVGSRHKLGGEPDFIQGEDIPVCEDCGEQMSFYGQLDSINDDYCIADCGMIYTFLCFDCNTVKSIIQSN
ncbi:hypothetical protein [Microbulbifer sp. SSSA005]|uniref:hypothetical protein n=1 Tax=Microbulbifer sp. SSSA005 TaxID=3243378 RepID=UPI00403A056D